MSFVTVHAAPLDGVADLIERGHWKQARAIVETRLKEAPNDAAALFFLSQIRNAFGDRTSPLPLAERAVAIDGSVARYHRQIAEVLGVMAQHSNAFQQLFLARRFRKEIDAALALDPRDVQALRDLLEFYLLAPGIAGGDRAKAESTADRIVAIDQAEGFMAKARIAEFEHRAAESEKWLKRAAAVSPPSYRAQMALARYYLEAEHRNLQFAESAARNGLRLDPSRVDAYSILAEIYASESRWSELDNILSESARNVPDDLTPYDRAASRLLSAGNDLSRAESYLRTYTAQEPEGNEPTLADAQRDLDRIARAGAGAPARRATERGTAK